MSTWYAAHVVMCVHFTEGPQDHYPIWENIYLIEADSTEQAFTKAERIGRQQEEDHDDSFRWDGRRAEWYFAGIRKLTDCEPHDTRPGDGTEITYLQYSVPSAAELDKLLDLRRVAITLDDRT